MGNKKKKNATLLKRKYTPQTIYHPIVNARSNYQLC
jgi:hypothetical protein